jgi:hypothetical protein
MPPPPTAGEPPFVPRQVLLFSGHRVDAPGRAPPRFPAALVPAVAHRIAALLDELGADHHDLALAQAAAGGDLLFLEACLARGVPCRVLLPLPVQAFIAQSVLPSADGEHWLARFDALRARLPGPMVLMDDAIGPTPAGENPWVRAAAWQLDSAFASGAAQVCLVCVWDGGRGDGPGGTAHMVDAVRLRGGQVHWIDTRGL